jgi:hypothetical protein
MSLGFGKTWVIDGEEYDMWIKFSISSYSPARSGDYYNPPEYEEFEFEFENVEFDPSGDPVPESIQGDIEEWFYTNKEAIDRAYDVASEIYQYHHD